MNNLTKLAVTMAVLVALMGCSAVMAEESDAAASTIYVGGVGASDDNAGSADAPLASFSKAITAAGSGGTVILLDDVSTEQIQVLDNRKNINLGGHTLTIVGDSTGIGIQFFGSTISIENGTIVDSRDSSRSGGYTAISTGAATNLTLDNVNVEIYDSLNSSDSNNVAIKNEGSVTMIDSKITSVSESDADSGSIGVVVLGHGSMVKTAKLILQGDSTISVGQFGISGNGSIVNDDGTSSGGEDIPTVTPGKDYRGTTIIIQDKSTVEARNGWGIYHPQDGTLTISDDATVSGLTGIEMRSGTLEIDGGTVKSTAENMTSQANGGGPTTVGAAIAIVQHTTKLDLNIGIHDGAEVSGPTAVYQCDLQNNGVEGTSRISILVDGGSFTSTVAGENAKAIDVQNITGFINGGNFVGLVTEGAIKTGYSLENGSIVADNPVANIGNKTFSSLLDAIDAAEDGDTIEFTGYTAAFNSLLVIEKGVNIEFAGQNQQITINGAFTGPGIKFTSGSSSISGSGMIVDNRGINGGNGFSSIVVEGPNATLTYSSKLQSYAPSTGYNGNLAFEVADGAELILDGAVITEIAYPQANSSNGGVGVFGPGESGKDNPTKLIVRGNTTISVGGFAIFGNGSTKDSDTSKDYRYTEIVIEGGSIKSTGSTAIYHPQLGSLIITGGEITGPGAVEFRAGDLIITGNPVITSTEATLQENTNSPGSGNSIYGAAIAVSQHSTDFDISVSISGGTFKGVYAFYEKDLINEDVDNIWTTISGGTYEGTVGSLYSENMTEFVMGGSFTGGTLAGTYIKDGYELKDGSVIATDPVASIDGQGFATLAEAMEAAGSGDTVVLLKDITDCPRIELDDGTSYTLNLNGFDIIFAQNAYFHITTAGLNITGSGTIREGSPYYGPIFIETPADAVPGNDYVSVTIGQGVTVEGWAPVFIDYNSSATVKNAYGVTVNVYGTLNSVLDSTGAAGHGIYVNGTIAATDDFPVINVHDGSIITSHGNGAYIAGYAELNVNGGSITGETGIEIRAGNLNIDGGTITATGTEFDSAPNGNGSTTDGVAVVVSQHTTDLPISVDISGGRMSGLYALYQATTDEGNIPEIIEVEITGGEFVTTDSTGEFSAVWAEDCTGFIRGGSFSSDVSEYCVDGFVTIASGNGEYVAQSGFTVTFDVEGVETVVRVPSGSAVPAASIPALPNIAGFKYVWMTGGSEWDPSSVVTSDMIVEAVRSLVLSVSISVGDDGTTLTATPSCLAQGVQYAYQWTKGGVIVESATDASITVSGPGVYAVTVTATVDSHSATVTADLSYRPTVTDPEVDVPEFDITHDGDSAEASTDRDTVVITSDGEHDDVSLDVTFTDGSDRVAGISINGTVSEGGVTVSVNPIGYDDLAGYASGLDCVGLGGVDVSLTRVSGFQMIIKVPFVSDGSMFVGAADAYYIDEGELVPVVCRVMGEEVWIYTDHNTPYMVVVTEIAGSPVFEDDPTVDPEPEIPPLPFPDDDDDYVPIPPLIVQEDPGNDDTKTVVACAAAAVVAAILAILLASLYRRK